MRIFSFEQAGNFLKVVCSSIMEKHPVATVINFCTNESRFIESCLEQALIFSRQVVVSVSSHFFDGTPENRSLLEKIYAAFPQCYFVEYPFVPKKIRGNILKSVGHEHFWHCASRLVGFHCLKEEIDTVLFLDADEVADGERVQQWLDCSDYQKHRVLKLANYWYFREPCYRAETFEDSIVLIQKKFLTADLLIHPDERCSLYNSLSGPKQRMVTGVDGQPLFHHFSWVRTQEEMLKKVRSWGHKKDRDWESLVAQEFSSPFKGIDFVHGYRFSYVNPPFSISLETPKFQPNGGTNIRRFTEDELSDLIQLKKTSLWRLLFS